MAAPVQVCWEPHPLILLADTMVSAPIPLCQEPKHKGSNGLPKDWDQSHLCQGTTSNFQGPRDSNNISGEPQGNNHRADPSVLNSAPVAPERFRTK